MKGRRQKPEVIAPVYVPKPDDVWLEQLRKSCARAVFDWLKAGLNVRRSIDSLTGPELMGMAEAATACWISEVSKRLKLAPSSRESFQFRPLVMSEGEPELPDDSLSDLFN